MLMQFSSLGSAAVRAGTVFLLAWVGNLQALADDGATVPQTSSTEDQTQTQTDADNSSMESQLWSAIARGDVTGVRSSVDAGVNVNLEQSVSVEGFSADQLREAGLRGLTPVVLAALEGQVEVTRTLIDAGADVDAMTVRATDGDGVEFLGTALMAAARNSHVNVAQLLIERGVDVMASWRNMNALITAADTGNVDIVTLLVSAGAYKPGTLNGHKALQTAKARGHTEVAEILQAGLDEYAKSAPRVFVEGVRDGVIEGLIKAYVERGMPENEPETLQLRQAAEGGNADAQARLGLAYFLGKGVKKHEAESERWFRKAAEQGNANAQFGLGALYLNGGRGVRQSYVLAHMWLSIAVANGASQARSAAHLIDIAESEMTSREIRRATRRARRCMDSSYQSCGR